MASTLLNTTATALLWLHPGSYFFALFSQLKPVAFTTGNTGAPQNKNAKINQVFTSIVNEFKSEGLIDTHLLLVSNRPSIVEAITSFIDRGVIASSEVFETDEAAFRFLCKRQLYHVLHRNPTKITIKMAIILNATMLMVRHYFDSSFFTSALFYFGILTLSRKIFIAPLERAADDFAIHRATPSELKGGLRWIRTQESYLYSIMNFIHSALGPFSSAGLRADKIQDTLSKQGITYSPKVSELQPISALFDREFRGK